MQALLRIDGSGVFQSGSFPRPPRSMRWFFLRYLLWGPDRGLESKTHKGVASSAPLLGPLGVFLTLRVVHTEHSVIS